MTKQSYTLKGAILENDHVELLGTFDDKFAAVRALDVAAYDNIGFDQIEVRDAEGELIDYYSRSGL